jgi:murein DD-endopeptidase MepM/ murein hydrolase activator NlpD
MYGGLRRIVLVGALVGLGALTIYGSSCSAEGDVSGCGNAEAKDGKVSGGCGVGVSGSVEINEEFLEDLEADYTPSEEELELREEAQRIKREKSWFNCNAREEEDIYENLERFDEAVRHENNSFKDKEQKFIPPTLEEVLTKGLTDKRCTDGNHHSCCDFDSFDWESYYIIPEDLESLFGCTSQSREQVFNNGIDIYTVDGDVIDICKPGMFHGGYEISTSANGNTITVEHGFVYGNWNLYSTYSNLSAVVDEFEFGVYRGATIGTVDLIGEDSEPYLHLTVELRKEKPNTNRRRARIFESDSVQEDTIIYIDPISYAIEGNDVDLSQDGYIIKNGEPIPANEFLRTYVLTIEAKEQLRE